MKVYHQLIATAALLMLLLVNTTSFIKQYYKLLNKLAAFFLIHSVPGIIGMLLGSPLSSRMLV